MGRLWDTNAVTRNLFTTDLGVSTALSESPLQEGLLYVGTDDGLVQVTEDGGKDWQKTDNFPGVPEMTTVSDLCASSHDTNTVYAAFNNYQRGDFKPYLLKSDDRGRSWTSIAGNLPERHFVWCVVEDHVNANLLFAGTEFGLFFTADGGKQWTQLRGGMPTIAVRDIEIQKRETDLVCATFGRGFFILDDYTPLRYVTPETLAKEAALFPLRHAYVYDEITYTRAAQGNHVMPNPEFGAAFTYFVGDELAKTNAKMVLTVADAAAKEVRGFTNAATAGLHRIHWDLRGAGGAAMGRRGGRGEEQALQRAEEEEEEAMGQQSATTAELQRQDGELAQPQPEQQPPGGRGFGRGRGGRGFGGFGGGGPLVKPGKYTVTLTKLVNDGATQVGEPQTFDVVPLPGANPVSTMAPTGR
jgi:hypothetical protein